MAGPRLAAAPARIEGRLADGRWVVAGRAYRPALLVSAGLVGSLPDLTREGLARLTLPDLGPVELLLLGTGATLSRPPPAFAAKLGGRGIRVEPMDSPAAARTFNVLAAEERLVAALIL